MRLLRAVYALRPIVTGRLVPRPSLLLAIAVAVSAVVAGAGGAAQEGEPPPAAVSHLWDYRPDNDFVSRFLLHNGILADSLSRAVWRGLPPAPRMPLSPADSAGALDDLEDEAASPPPFGARSDTLSNVSFGPSHLALDIKSDPRRPFLVYDSEADRIREGHTINEAEIGRPANRTLPEFIEEYTARSLRRVWVTETLTGLKQEAAFRGRDTASNIRLELPVQMPKAVESIFGPGAQQLTVRGSERITMSGTRRWQVGQRKTEYGGPSGFPQLDMKQDLNVTLTGTVGEKLHIDVAQNSNAPTALDNSIKLRYEGYEDEIIKRVDLGNTSLALPGTRYVSYGGQHTGLFGVNVQAKLAALDLQMIASKEEGEAESRSFSGSTETREQQIRDIDFVRNQFFFFADPDGPPPRIDLSQVQVWIDDRDQNNNNTQGARAGAITLTGAAEGDTTGWFHRLELNQDFTLERELMFGHTILALRRSLRQDEVLGVAYVDTVGSTVRTVGVVNNEQLYLKALKPPDNELNLNDLTQGPWAATRKLPLRNVYYLNAENIDITSLSVQIHKDQGATDPTNLNEVPLIQILGLDRLREQGETYVAGHDNKVDWDRVSPQSGYLVFPDLRPFAPDAADVARMGSESDIAAERGFVLPEAESFPDMYDRAASAVDATLTPSRYYFSVQVRSRVTSYQIPNAMNLIPGSVVVTKNEIPLTASDVRVDYDLGTVEVLQELLPSDRINISYQYAPLFAMGQKTLAGMAARYAPGPDFAVGTTWVFQSKGSPDRRVRLEQEPVRTIVGDVNLSVKKEPDFLTRLTDAIPLVNATEKSLFQVDAEVGVSLPNPNTRNEVYLDDFEGVDQNESLSLTRSSWRPSSIPATLSGDPQDLARHRGFVRWYDPRSVREGDLQPTLSEAERNDIRSTLAVQFRPDETAGLAESSWVSLVQPISKSGSDLSRQQFLDIWVNDGIPWDSRHLRQGVIHVDLGTVSEDAVWDKEFPVQRGPNGILDTEDSNPRDFIFNQIDEDTGLDAIGPGESGDTSLDDYAAPSQPVSASWEEWDKINGTEGNRIWDTEDLDASSFLETRNDYFEFTIRLGANMDGPDSTSMKFLVTDVTRDFGTAGLSGPSTNGWRRYRIPLNDTTVAMVGSPQWQTIRQTRVWLTGFDDRPAPQAPYIIQFGGLEILGNRWLERPIRFAPDSTAVDTLLAPGDLALGEEFLVSGVNNKEHSDFYDAPFEVRVQDNVPEKEQSLWLEVRNFPDRHQGQAYRRYLDAQDFTLYDRLKLFLKRRDPGGPALEFFVRFARDSLNYYEYRTPVPDGWRGVEVPLADLSDLKRETPDARGVVVRPVPGDPVDDAYILRGTPSFTQVREIYVGVRNVSGQQIASGSVWLDELRLTDVKKTVGNARRLAAHVKMSDLLDVSTLYENRGADFLQIGNTRGSGTHSEDIGVNANFRADKFLTALRLNAPVTVAYQRNRQTPKFQTGNDVQFRGEARDRNVSERDSRKVDVRLSRQPTQNPWLRYTLDAVSLTFSAAMDRNAQPTRRDSTQVITGAANYAASFATVPPLALPRGIGLRYLPSNVSVGSVTTQRNSDQFQRRNGDLNEPLVLQTRTSSRSSTLNLSAVYSPVKLAQSEPITYSIQSQRDLRTPEKTNPGRWIGKEISRVERLSVSSSFDALDGWISPSVSWEGDFNGNHGVSLRRPGDDPFRDLWEMDNSSRTTVSMQFPVSGLIPAPPARVPERMRAPGDTTGAEPQGPSISPLQQLGRLLRFDTLSGSYEIRKGSSYDRVYGEPSLAYQLGLTRNRGDRGVAGQHLALFSDNNSIQARAAFRVLGDVLVETNYSRTSGQQRRDNTVTKNYTRTWPDMKVDWGALVQKVKFGGLVRSMTASTRYSRTQDRSGQLNNERSGVQNNWNPLVTWNASWKNGLATALTANVQSSVQETEGLGNRNVQESSRKNISFSVRQTINTTKGLPLPFGGKQIKMKSNIDLTLKFDFARATRVSRDQTGREIPTEKRDDGSIGLNGGYNFSKSVSGNVGLNLSQVSDKIRGRTERAIGLVVSAGFNF